MHKKLAADLTSLAHSILQMKNKDDVFALKEKAYMLYEKLSVLAYVEEYINNTPNPEHTKEELLKEIEKIDSPNAEEKITIADKASDAKTETEIVEESVAEVSFEKPEIAEEESKEIKEDELQGGNLFTSSEAKKEKKEAPTLEEELQDTIAADVVVDLFQNESKKSLNDKLQEDIQIGLNDRIAFVKNLFEGSQEDFNRVVSQLNTIKTEKEAKKFINKMVKPDYDWTDKEEFEERFISIVERKFS